VNRVTDRMRSRLVSVHPNGDASDDGHGVFAVVRVGWDPQRQSRVLGIVVNDDLLSVNETIAKDSSSERTALAKTIPHEFTTFTPQTLQRYNGLDGRRILLAINGIVFDVSAGRNFYGPTVRVISSLGPLTRLWPLNAATRRYVRELCRQRCLSGHGQAIFR
jgi:hypothetical protein